MKIQEKLTHDSCVRVATKISRNEIPRFFVLFLFRIFAKILGKLSRNFAEFLFAKMILFRHISRNSVYLDQIIWKKTCPSMGALVSLEIFSTNYEKSSSLKTINVRIMCICFKFIGNLFEYVTTQFPPPPSTHKGEVGSKKRKKERGCRMYMIVMKQIDSFKHCSELQLCVYLKIFTREAAMP